MPRVSVIVPARDAGQTLARALEAIAGQEAGEAFEVIVVDDGSRDDTARIAQAAGPPVRVVRQAALGPAAARNAGIAHASGTLLAFCDADVYPAPGWLAAGVRALAGADLVQGRVEPDPGHELGPFDRTLWIDGAVGLWETANLFVSRSACEAAGGFEQWLAPRRGKALAEDVWFGYRALRAGARPGFSPDALAHHAVFPRGWRAYAAERARLRFFPAMTGRMPELRAAFLYRHAFLNARTARFDLAVAAAVIAAARRSPLPLLAAVPYGRELHRHARRCHEQGPVPPAVAVAVAVAVAAADVAADLVGFAALAVGSVRYGAPVL
ncbi:MAG TPA: glycosyltransferase family A protein [Solirubrobacteraceae bacterium]|jgi:glycosyltransferase involved in cell wall biosynthesis|nr:glycosyltransferase family A protein [Solirubrobacteraceae bacterium]